MFIDDSSFVEFPIYYKKSGRNYIAYGKEEFNKLSLSEEAKKNYKCLNVKMRELSWGLFNDLNEEALMTDAIGNRVLNFKRYKENKLKKLLMGWDATKKGVDNNAIPVPVNEKTILSLAPEIAEAILVQYDAVSVINEEEEKK